MQPTNSRISTFDSGCISHITMWSSAALPRSSSLPTISPSYSTKKPVSSHSSVSKKRISASVVNGSVFSAIAVSMRFSRVNVFFLISDYTLCYHMGQDMSTEKCMFLEFIWKCGIFATVIDIQRYWL